MTAARWRFILVLFSLTMGAIIAAATPASAGWSPLGSPLDPTVLLHLDLDRPELLYAQAVFYEQQAYLWRSEDAGTTWRNLQAGLQRSVSALAIDPTNPKVIWAWTTSGELWRSGDAGDTWSRRFATPPGDSATFSSVLKLLVDPRHPETLFRVDYHSGENGVHVAVSRDGGASFHQGPLIPHSLGGDKVFFNAKRGELVAFGKGLEVSTDGGQTWSVRGSYHGALFWGGQLAASDPGTIYGLPFDNACAVRSDDAGAHWQKLAPLPLPLNKYTCDDIAVDPKDARHVWIAGYRLAVDDDFDLLFESKDGGETWSGPFRAPAAGLTPAGGKALYSDGSLYGEPGLYVSQDGGRTWKRRDQGITAGDARLGLVAQRLPSGGPGRRLVVALDYVGYSYTFRSDGGKEWVKAPLPLPHALSGAGGSTIVAIGQGGIRRSRNGGETWRFVPSTPPEANALFADLVQPRYQALQASDGYGSYSYGFWISDDSGATWRLSRKTECFDIASINFCLDVSAYAVDPFDARRRWIASQLELSSPTVTAISNDAGASWHPTLSSPPPTIGLAADPRVKDRVLALTDDGLFVSEDGGDHWHPLGQGLPEGAVIRQLARDASTATWYAATKSHGIYRSFDGCATWQLLEGAPDLESPTIAVDPRKPTALLAAFRGQGVWRWTP
jgi:photosystem II stability/assembly factor-like uncharacterized protein